MFITKDTHRLPADCDMGSSGSSRQETQHLLASLTRPDFQRLLVQKWAGPAPMPLLPTPAAAAGSNHNHLGRRHHAGSERWLLMRGGALRVEGRPADSRNMSLYALPEAKRKRILLQPRDKRS